MNITYDLRYATDHFPGIGTHAFHLLATLLRIDGPERYRLLWNPRLANRRFPVESLRQHPRVEWCQLDASPLRPAGVYRLVRFLRSHRQALYFSPFYLAPPACPCPVVLTLHDVLPLTTPALFSPASRLRFRVAMAFARGARAVVTSSGFARGEILRNTRIRPDRVRLIRPGTPAAPRLRPARAARAPAGPYALVVGINKPHKNLETLAAAWQRFGEAPPLELVSVGPCDPRYPDLAALGRRWGATGLSSLGPVDEAELESLYAHATLLLFPSLHEGFGFPLVEAFARGIPAVVADVPALREIGEGAARLVPSLDAAAWHAEVSDLASNGEARSTLADAARARAAELSYERCAGEMLALWRELVA